MHGSSERSREKLAVAKCIFIVFKYWMLFVTYWMHSLKCWMVYVMCSFKVLNATCEVHSCEVLDVFL